MKLAKSVQEIEGKILLTPPSSHLKSHSSSHNVIANHLKFDDDHNLTSLDPKSKRIITRASKVLKISSELATELLLVVEDDEFSERLSQIDGTPSLKLHQLPSYQKIGEPNRQQYLQTMRDLLLSAIRNSNISQTKQILSECPKALLFTFAFNPFSSATIPITSMSIPSILHHPELRPINSMNGNKIIEENITKHFIEKITFLHLACQQSDPLLVEYLLQFYEDVNIQSTDGRTPLFYTTSCSVISLLCQEGGNPNHIDRKGHCPLHLYTSSALYSCVEMILHYGADPMLYDSKKRINSLLISSKKGDYRLISSLLSQGILSNTSSDQLTSFLNQTDYEGNTLLHHLSMNTSTSSTNIIKSIMLLLNLGCNPFLKNQRGVTSLHYLIANQILWNHGTSSHDEILQLIQLILLQHQFHFDINIKDNDHCTLLIIACAHRKFDLCKLLLSNKADMNIPCPMNSYMLRRDNPAFQEEMLDGMDCTASDLFPPGRKRAEIFANISSYQTPIPQNSRHRCMNCAKSFNSNPFTSVFLNTEKYNCQMCGRLLCDGCIYAKEYTLSQLPPTLLEGNNAPTEISLTSSVKLCIVCQPILVENFGLAN